MLHHLPRFFLPILFLVQMPCSAQLAQAWSLDTGPVNWIRTTAAGALIACTAKGLHGIDTEKGTLSWTIDELANAPESGYEEIARTPFVNLIPDQRPEDLLIVEPFSGKVVFNSEEAGISNIASKYFLYQNQVIVLVGQKADKTAAMSCVDMNTGKVLWSKDDSFSKLTACNSVGPNELILSTLFYAYKFDSRTGEELWKKCPDPGFEQMAGFAALLDKGGANLGGLTDGISGVFVTTPYAKDLCFMGMQSKTKKTVTDSQGNTKEEIIYKTFVNGFSIKDGSYAWSEPLEFNQQLGAIIPLKKGLLIGAGDKKAVDLLDYATGNGLWGKKGKGINVKGVLSGAVEIGDQVLLTSGGSDGVVTLMNGMGEEVWKKPVKLDGVVKSVTLMGNDVLIASEAEVEVIDLATGASQLDKPLQGGASNVTTGGDRTFVFNTKDDLLYAVPKSGGAAKAVTSAPLAFEGKEDANSVEYTEQGLVISSDQNIAMVTTDGSVKYQKYYPAGRESGLTRALKYASAVRAAYYTAAFGYTSAAFGAASQSIQVQDANSAIAKEVTTGMSQVYGEAAQTGMDATARFFKEANARFKATASTNTVHFMLTDAGKREYKLIAVDKSTGSELGSIPLGKDKEPVYEVDGFTNNVYLVDGSSVKGFKM
ncbi:MAG: PQQ-binding-like beta-propeller repeat protein [Flavobacteriales bacterium]|nr:PQQ-binding-like beta-propeller repeat protein [Flavobacteriales bacterium]